MRYGGLCTHDSLLRLHAGLDRSKRGHVLHIALQKLNAVPQTRTVHNTVQLAPVSRCGVILHEVYLLQRELDHGEAALDCGVHEGEATAQKA